MENKGICELFHSGIDLYSDATLADPYPVYRQLLDLGGAVYLENVDACFIGRYQDVRMALKDWQVDK